MRKKLLILSVVFVLLVFFLFNYIDTTKQETIDRFDENSRQTVKATYLAILETYETAAKKDFYAFMDRDDVLERLHAFKKSKSRHERNVLRGELYRLLYKPYEQMRRLHVRQFHIHTDDGKSLLRMHLPYESGDALLDLRKSIRIVNEEHRSVTGFEGGRIFPGYRYVFPIIDKGEYLGSVEFSLSFDGVEKKLAELLGSIYDSELIMDRKESLDKAFQWHKKLLFISAFNGNYYIEKPVISAVSKRHLHDKLLMKIKALVKSSPEFTKKLHAHKDFSVSVIDQNKGYLANFISVINTENKHAGYLVSYCLQDELIGIDHIYTKYKIIAFTLSLIIVALLFVIFEQFEKLHKNKKELQAINDSLNEAQKVAHFGVLTYDYKKDDFYLSDEVYEIYGVSPETFHPSFEEFLSLVHSDDREKVEQIYKESLQNKSNYELQYRIIKHSDEIRFIEQHVSHEVDTKGELLKSTVTLYDITAQMRAYENLQRFINLQSSIVILTDGIHFQFANKSFYSFFGYENLEAFTKKYQGICERFVAHNGFFSLADMTLDDKTWIDGLLKLSKRQRIVSMVDSTGTPHGFSVKLNKFDQENYVVEFIDITDEMLEKLQLEKQLTKDQLTKAYNRVYFETNIGKIMNLNQQNGSDTGIVFFDIDHFKRINDTYGHKVGDDVLATLVKIIDESIRSYDHLIRWGGEEFIIIARVKAQTEIENMVEHIREKIENYDFKEIPKLTCSFGIAIHQEGESIKSTVSRADDKLYEAKNNGRNQVRI